MAPAGSVTVPVKDAVWAYARLANAAIATKPNRIRKRRIQQIVRTRAV